MDADNNAENGESISTRDYDAAIQMSGELERQVAEMVSCATPIGLELQIATMFIACIYPAVWAVVVFFYVTVCVAGVKRGAVRECLKKHDIEGAKAALDSAKTWNGLMILMEIIMGGIEVWGIFQLLHHIKGA